MAVPFRRAIARFNRRVTNPILDPLVWHLPGFGRIEHVGRRSGTVHVAPMMGFPSRDRKRVTFALTYGSEVNWVRNALAAGRLAYRTRTDGRVELIEPVLHHEPACRAMPRLVRIPLRLMGVDEFLEARVAPATGDVDQAGTAAS